jgi:uncharacterized phage-associated protein
MPLVFYMEPLHLAQYLVNSFGHVPGGVTPMKLQKLLYYVKAWSVVDGEDIVDGSFSKWKHGPVNREVYEHFKGYGRQPIQPVALGPDQHPKLLMRSFTDFIGHSYARFPAITLSKMTHDERPWHEAEPGEEISVSAMKEFYSSQPFAQNLPFDPVGKPYVAVESPMDRAFTLDMSTEDARLVNVYSSYQDYVDRLSSAGYAKSEDWYSRLMR